MVRYMLLEVDLHGLAIKSNSEIDLLKQRIAISIEMSIDELKLRDTSRGKLSGDVGIDVTEIVGVIES